MRNPYDHEPAEITDIKQQTNDIKLFRFEFTQKIPGYRFTYRPGQFIELSIPGFGEAPFAPCGQPQANFIELCVRRIGKFTERLHEMKIGDKVGLRGPYGNGWPKLSFDKNNKNLLIVVGGLGLVPLRTLILGKDKFLGPDIKLQIFYGARRPEEMLFRHEFNKWRDAGVDLELTINEPCPEWTGGVGLVTTLFDKFPSMPASPAFVCGPPVMYKPVLQKLATRRFEEKEIFLSLERRMHCGLGVCQHCGVGPYYVCKDGPIFSYDILKKIPDAI